VGGEFTCIKTCHLRALLDDAVDSARFECPRGNIAPAINFSKHAALVDFCCFQPAGEGFDRTAGQIDGFIVIGTTGFGASEVDRQSGEGRAPSLAITGSSRVSCSIESRATSLRLRPPEAKATIRMARSRSVRKSSPTQVSRSFVMMSPVIACALLRLRGRLVARTARRRADLTDGAENDPSSPRQRVNVDQLDRRRRTVAGACGPDARKKPWLRNSASTPAGMP